MTERSEEEVPFRNARADESGREGRRFTRFAAGRSVAEGYWPLPNDGLCLSSFLLLSPENRPKEILVGRIAGSADWSQIGALDPRRVRLNAEGWMLPSCHLLYFESPDDAARRVLKEQLGLERLPLEGPAVYSEKYSPRRQPEREEHWDLEFLYRGTVPPTWPRQHPAWAELRFIEPSLTPRAAFTRSHDEILELAGFRIG